MPLDLYISPCCIGLCFIYTKAHFKKSLAELKHKWDIITFMLLIKWLKYDGGRGGPEKWRQYNKVQ